MGARWRLKRKQSEESLKERWIVHFTGSVVSRLGPDGGNGVFGNSHSAQVIYWNLRISCVSTLME